MTAEPGSSRPGWGLALTSLLFLLFVAGTRLLLAATLPALLAGVRDPLDGYRLLLALLLLLSFAAPALGLTHRWGREIAIRRLTRAAALAGPFMALPGTAGVVAAALAVAAVGAYLSAAIGFVQRRSVAAGVAGGLVLEHVLRIARAAPAPEGGAPFASGAVLLVAAGLAIWCERRWQHAPAEARRDSFERRAGGLRLRGAVSLGALLFLEARLLAPAGGAASGWFLALLVAGGAFAWVVLAHGSDVYRHRSLAVSLALVAAAGALLPQDATGVAPAALRVAGHTSALLLLDRALAPVSGRRSGWNLVSGFATLVGLAVAHTGFEWRALPARLDATVLAAAGLLVLASYLTPRPRDAPAAASPGALVGIAIAGWIAAIFILVLRPG